MRFAKKDIPRTAEAYASGEFTDKRKRSFWALPNKQYPNGSLRLFGEDMSNQRTRVIGRDKCCCVKCGRFVGGYESNYAFGRDGIHPVGATDCGDVDHILERGKGGSDDLDNLQLVCSSLWFGGCSFHREKHVRPWPKSKPVAE